MSLDEIAEFIDGTDEITGIDDNGAIWLGIRELINGFVDEMIDDNVGIVDPKADVNVVIWL